MWKIVVGFAVFAAIALFVLTRPGADIDLGGEEPAKTASAAH